MGWLDIGVTSDPTGKRGEAAVRDIENTLEVLVVQRSKGEYRMLPWLAKHGARRIPVHEPPGGELAKAMAECSIQLPRELCFRLDDTIEELETIALGEIYEWQKSPWLKGELFLVLDEQLTVKLCGYRLHYDQAYGMISRKIKEGDHTA
jgi:CRISPR-associated endonuclease/helicase Cas3